MYKIERTEFGLKLTFGGVLTADELRIWLDESRALLAAIHQPFCVFVDMRTCSPLDELGQTFMREGQRLYKDSGMIRSVVIVRSPVTKMQFKRIACESGIYDWERYIDVETIPDWERAGLDWLLHSIDPDRKTVPAAAANSR